MERKVRSSFHFHNEEKRTAANTNKPDWLPTIGNLRSSESGMVTSEIAMGLIPISFMAVLLFYISSAMGIYLEAQDASRELARSASIGRNIDPLIEQKKAGLPGAEIDVKETGTTVSVTVKARPQGPFSVLRLDMKSTTVAAKESGVR